MRITLLIQLVLSEFLELEEVLLKHMVFELEKMLILKKSIKMNIVLEITLYKMKCRKCKNKFEKEDAIYQ